MTITQVPYENKQANRFGSPAYDQGRQRAMASLGDGRFNFEF